MNNANTIALEAYSRIIESDRVKLYLTPENAQQLADDICIEFMEKFEKFGEVSDKIAKKLASDLVVKAQKLAASGVYNKKTNGLNTSDFCEKSGSYRY